MSRILLLDDDIAEITAVKRLVARTAHRAQLATTAADAAGAIERDRPDLLVVASACDGGQALSVVREAAEGGAASPLPIIVLGDAAGLPAGVRALALPVDPELLGREIEALLAMPAGAPARPPARAAAAEALRARAAELRGAAGPPSRMVEPARAPRALGAAPGTVGIDGAEDPRGWADELAGLGAGPGTEACEPAPRAARRAEAEREAAEVRRAAARAIAQKKAAAERAAAQRRQAAAAAAAAREAAAERAAAQMRETAAEIATEKQAAAEREAAEERRMSAEQRRRAEEDASRRAEEEERLRAAIASARAELEVMRRRQARAPAPPAPMTPALVAAPPGPPPSAPAPEPVDPLRTARATSLDPAVPSQPAPPGPTPSASTTAEPPPLATEASPAPPEPMPPAVAASPEPVAAPPPAIATAPAPADPPSPPAATVAEPVDPPSPPAATAPAPADPPSPAVATAPEPADPPSPLAAASPGAAGPPSAAVAASPAPATSSVPATAPSLTPSPAIAEPLSPPPSPSPSPSPLASPAPPRLAVPAAPTLPLPPEELRAGTLAELPAPRLLALAARVRLAGRLDLEGEVVRSLWFEGGRVVGAASADPAERVEALAVRLGLVTRDQRQQVAAQAATLPARRAALLLLDAGFLKPAELGGLVRRRTEEVVFGIFGDAGARFRWVSDEVPADERGAVERPPLALAVEGVRRRWSAPRLDPLLGGPDTLLSADPDGPPAEALALSEEERQVAALADGLRTLGEIERASPLDALATRQVLAALVQVGALAVRRLATSAGPEAARAIDLARLADKLDQARRCDYFTVLGLPRSTTSHEVREAAGRLEEALEPRHLADAADQALAAGLGELLQVVRDARAVLADDRLRQAYLAALGD